MSDLLHRLGSLGARYKDPLEAIDWSCADPDLPWLPGSVLCAPDSGAPQDMPPDFLRRFSQVEFARLCAAGLWLEGLLIGRVASRGFLAAKPAEARIVLHEVREEAGHSLMFLEMIDRAELAGVSLLGPTRLLTWVAQRLDPNDAAFWAMVYIGESVTDTFAVKALKATGEDGEAICPVARQVLALHHRDEARHIAAARALLDARIARMRAIDRVAFRHFVSFLLSRFLRATLYPTAASLAALGFADPRGAAKAALQCPRRRSLAEACAKPAFELAPRSMDGAR